MTKSAYDRASKILHDLRQCILEMPPQGSSEEDACNKKIDKLYGELEIICSKAHIRSFSYGYGSEKERDEGARWYHITSVKCVYGYYSDIEFCCQEGMYGAGPEGPIDPSLEYVRSIMKDELTVQARKWLDANKGALSEATHSPKEPSAYTLVYDPSTGKFSFSSKETEAISRSDGTRKRRIAEKLMTYWGEGKPCPQREILDNPDRKPPQGFHDDISKIRKTLESIGINMPKLVGETYLPPEEPQSFTTVSRHLD